MGRAVVYVLIAAAFAIFFVLSPSKFQDGKHQEPTRRLGFKFRTPTFDPLVAKIERLGEEDESESGGDAIGVKKSGKRNRVGDAYRNYYDEGRLNITLRLMVLFPLLDCSPKDGAISYEELSDWITGQAIERLNYRTRKQLAFYDKNGDGAISFHEYLPKFTDEDIARNETEYGEGGWWRTQFTNADVDQNALLNFDELKDSFLHPEDSSNYRIQNWLLREKMKRMDHDRDGKLNFDEFLHHVYDIYKNYIEFETQGEDIPSPEEKFDELDLDNDELWQCICLIDGTEFYFLLLIIPFLCRVLLVEELRPLFQYLHPGEVSHAQHYTSHLINEADDNKDGYLTLDEMLNHAYVFYSPVYENLNDDYEDDYHDEL